MVAPMRTESHRESSSRVMPHLWYTHAVHMHMHMQHAHAHAMHMNMNMMCMWSGGHQLTTYGGMQLVAIGRQLTLRGAAPMCLPRIAAYAYRSA